VPLLIQLLRAFVILFGVTPPKKDEEEKWALYLFYVLIIVSGIAVIVIAVLFKIFV
jgi:heme/copper-type cytochrome/quinol oxidase subunit 2